MSQNLLLSGKDYTLFVKPMIMGILLFLYLTRKDLAPNKGKGLKIYNP